MVKSKAEKEKITLPMVREKLAELEYQQFVGTDIPYASMTEEVKNKFRIQADKILEFFMRYGLRFFSSTKDFRIK